MLLLCLTEAPNFCFDAQVLSGGSLMGMPPSGEDVIRVVGGRDGVLCLCVPNPCVERWPVVEVDAFSKGVEGFGIVWIKSTLRRP